MNIGNVISSAKKYTGKALKRLTIKDVDKTILNPIGVRATKFTSAAVIGGVALWGVGAGSYNYRRNTLASNAEYIGNIPSMDYDAVPNVDRKTGQRDFGATGELVFGLNRSRRG
jgi:hypothetical protein